MEQLKIFRCRGCGEKFPYQTRRPKYCAECGRLKLNQNALRWKNRTRRQTRQTLRKGDREEKFTGKSGFVSMVGGMSQAEIARELGLTKRTVEQVEREVLHKIRHNPELKKIWTILREELADGGQLPDGGPMGVAAKSGQLLDYQPDLARWWRLYDRLTEAECPEEAAECRAEIERFHQALGRAHQSFLTGRCGAAPDDD